LLQQHGKDLDGLLLQFQADSVLGEFASLRVELEYTEPDLWAGILLPGGWLHAFRSPDSRDYSMPDAVTPRESDATNISFSII
jgi:hypothetical protein